jgi:hypothetical protein
MSTKAKTVASDLQPLLISNLQRANNTYMLARMSIRAGRANVLNVRSKNNMHKTMRRFFRSDVLISGRLSITAVA